MKKLLLLTTTGCFLLFASSCDDKKNNQPTPEPTKWDLLTGKWAVTHFADDDNDNNIAEESEKYPLDATETHTLQFNTDGTLINKYEDSAYPDFNHELTQKWLFTNNETEILMIDNSEPNNIDSTYAIIHTLTANNMILKDKEFPTQDWVLLDKK